LLVTLGKIVKTQGLKGAFRVLPHGGDSANLARLERVTVADPRGVRFEAAVRKCRPKGSLFILTLEGIETIDRAQELVGGEVFAREEDLEPLGDDEYYWYELVSMTVVTDDGQALGVVQSVIATGANDVFVVSDGAREVLLPNIPEVILDVDREKRVITVHLLPGLI
jgi:16S rRNA processing protein RimM